MRFTVFRLDRYCIFCLVRSDFPIISGLAEIHISSVSYRDRLSISHGFNSIVKTILYISMIHIL